MKKLIQFEEMGVFAVSVFLLYKLNIHFAWWLYLILFFSPDLGMVGYAINTKFGAFTYNFFHHKATACILVILGELQTNNYLLFAGLLLLVHSSFDRVLGYGLKYTDNFKHTNVGYL